MSLTNSVRRLLSQKTSAAAARRRRFLRRTRLPNFEHLESRRLLTVSWSVTFNDPSATYSAYYAPIRDTLLAAANDWGRYFPTSNASIELGVDFTSSGIGPIGGGSSETTSYLGKNGALDVWEQSIGYEIRTGNDFNGATRDGHLFFRADYLANELWFDPTPTNRGDEAVPLNRTDAYSIMMHELGHALGFNGWRDYTTGALPGNYESNFDQLVTIDGSATPFFNGTAAMAAYGSQPVPLTYSNIMHVGNDTFGANTGTGVGHPGSDLIGDLMNGVVAYRGLRYNISPLDLAILQDLGLPVVVNPATTDFGDAPDTGPGTGAGNYETLLANGGPSHVIDTTQTTLFLGARVDGETNTTQGSRANGDDITTFPDDEDGLVEPAQDLVLTVGSDPTVRVRAANTTGAAATLYGWIDYNRDGVFDNANERTFIPVPTGTTKGTFTLVFPTIPLGTPAGATYARFRLSGDASAANATGAASGGEVEDYPASIVWRSDGTADSTKTKKIGSGTNGGPTLTDRDGFGNGIASLGDLDGDGIVDLAVGAPADSTEGDRKGAVHMLLLQGDGTVKSSVRIASGVNGGPPLGNIDLFGSSLASLGDLDGDGVTDLAVGTPLDDTGGYGRGAVHVLFLHSNGTVKSSTKIASGAGGGPALADRDNFGSGISALGDLDGDGVNELAVGAGLDDTGGPGRGAAYVLFMKPDGTARSSVKIASGTNGGPALNDYDVFGISVASLGDLDGDGVTDVSVGARTHGAGGATGAIHILLLNSNGTVKSSTKIASATGGGPLLPGGDEFGFSAVSLGDLDGDGVTDLCVGAVGDNTAGLFGGAIYVLLLNSNGTVKRSVKITDGTNGGPALEDHNFFGFSIGSLGDLDGDGIADLAVGAPGDDTEGTFRGAVHVLFLNPPRDFGDAPDTGAGTGTGNYETLLSNGGPSHVIDTTQHTLFLGNFLGAFSDIAVDDEPDAAPNARANGDDITITFQDDEDGLVEPAQDLVLTVGSAPAVRVWVTNETGAAATLYGWIDYNRDGVFDNATERSSVAVPDSTFSTTFTLTFPTIPLGTAAGATYTRFRLSSDAAAANPTGAAIGGEVEDYPATIVRRSDGTADSTKTSKIANNTSGGPTLANYDYFGTSAAALGDLDGDGVTDLAVGAVGDSTGGLFRGAVYVLLMNASGTVKSSVKIASGTNGGPTLADIDRFGISVAPLGDLDGNGVTELAVGAFGDDTGGDLRGAVHVLFLKDDGTVKSSVKIASGTNGGPTLSNDDYFGRSVASLGDLDGDGVTDLAVGAERDSTGGLNRGAVHVLLLNASGTVKSSANIASGTSGGPTLANGDRFGNSVAAVGDLDGDGVTDLAVGADRDSTGGSYRGAVHVLLLNADGTVKSSVKIASGTNGGPTLADLDRFGISVAPFGDLDGDGVTDLAVGAFGDATAGTSRGAVHVLLLKADGTIKSSVKIASGTFGGPTLANGDFFGVSVASLGDLDGDGVTDLAVGAHGDDTGGTNRGAVHVLFLTKLHVWHNLAKPFDVRGGNTVTPDDSVDAGDALAIINYINAFDSDLVPEDAEIGQPFGFLDTNKDDHVAPDDALSIINAINSGIAGEAEPSETQDESFSSAVALQPSMPRSDLAPDDLIGLLAFDLATVPKRRR